MIAEQLIVVCKYCNNEFNHKDIKPKKQLLDSFESSLKGRDYENVWICPKCKESNIVEKTKMIKSTLNKPFYLKVVEDPPEKHDGVENMMFYKKRMKKWFYTFLGELEYQLGLYRKEYTREDEENHEGVDDPGDQDFD